MQGAALYAGEAGGRAYRGGALADGLHGVLHLEEVPVGREDGEGAVVPRHGGGWRRPPARQCAARSKRVSARECRGAVSPLSPRTGNARASSAGPLRWSDVRGREQPQFAGAFQVLPRRFFHQTHAAQPPQCLFTDAHVRAHGPPSCYVCEGLWKGRAGGDGARRSTVRQQPKATDKRTFSNLPEPSKRIREALEGSGRFWKALDGSGRFWKGL